MEIFGVPRLFILNRAATVLFKTQCGFLLLLHDLLAGKELVKLVNQLSGKEGVDEGQHLVQVILELPSEGF